MRSATVTPSSFARTCPTNRRTACAPCSRIRDARPRLARGADSADTTAVGDGLVDDVAMSWRDDVDATRVEALHQADHAAHQWTCPGLHAGAGIDAALVAGRGRGV